jgi:hypothetical protein
VRERLAVTPDLGESAPVAVVLSREWRQRDLEERLEIWGPRVGEQAATTFARGRWLALAGFLAMIAWIIVCVALVVAPIGAAPVAISVVVFWPVILYGLTKGVRLEVRAMHEAAEVVATSSKVAVPIRNVEQFDDWLRRSKHSRFASADQA